MMLYKSVLKALTSAYIAHATFNACYGQTFDHNRDPGVLARIRHDAKITCEADLMVFEGRKALREFHYTEAIDLCQKSITYVRKNNSEDYYPAHILLGEIYLLQKRYDLVFAEDEIVRKVTGGSRLDMTLALALVGISKTSEARSILEKVVGTVDHPTNLRAIRSLWEMPHDQDPSEAALVASLYLVRAMQNTNDVSPEALFDLQRASKMVPDNASIELSEGMYYLHLDVPDCDNAETRFKAAFERGNAQTKKVARLGLSSVRSTREFLKRKSSGATSP